MKLMHIIIVIGLAQVVSANAMWGYLWPFGDPKKENLVLIKANNNEQQKQELTQQNQKKVNKELLIKNFFEQGKKIDKNDTDQDSLDTKSDSFVMHRLQKTCYYQVAPHPKKPTLYAFNYLLSLSSFQSIVETYIVLRDCSKKEDGITFINAETPFWSEVSQPVFNYNGSIVSFESYYSQEKYRMWKIRMQNLETARKNDLWIPRAIEYGFVWSKLKNLLAVNCLQQKIEVYQIDEQSLEGKKLYEIDGGFRETTQWNPKNNNLVAMQIQDKKNYVVLLDGEKGTKIAQWPVPDNFTLDKIQWNEGGTKLAITGFGQKKTFILDNKLQQLYTIDNENFTQQGNWVKNFLALYEYDGPNVRIFDTDAKQNKAVLKHEKGVTSAQINPQGTLVATTQKETFNNLRIWKTTGQHIPLKDKLAPKFPALDMNVTWNCDGSEIARQNIRCMRSAYPWIVLNISKLKDLIGEDTIEKTKNKEEIIKQ